MSDADTNKIKSEAIRALYDDKESFCYYFTIMNTTHGFDFRMYSPTLGTPAVEMCWEAYQLGKKSVSPSKAERLVSFFVGLLVFTGATVGWFTLVVSCVQILRWAI